MRKLIALIGLFAVLFYFNSFAQEATKKAPEKKATPKAAPKKASKKTPTVKESKAKVEVVEEEILENPVETKIEKKASKKEIEETEQKIHDEISTLNENFSWSDIASAISSLDFFVDHRSDECAEKGCDNIRASQQYCRLHYIANWYDIKRKRDILKEGRLQEFIEELISKYPSTYIEAIVDDLQDEKEFFKALSELNIATDGDFDDEDFDSTDEDDDDDIGVEARNFIPQNRFDDDN